MWRRSGIAFRPVPCAVDGLVFWCYADQAIAEWNVEPDDFRNLGKIIGEKPFHELSIDFF